MQIHSATAQRWLRCVGSKSRKAAHTQIASPKLIAELRTLPVNAPVGFGSKSNKSGIAMAATKAAGSRALRSVSHDEEEMFFMLASQRRTIKVCDRRQQGSGVGSAPNLPHGIERSLMAVPQQRLVSCYTHFRASFL